MQYQAVVSGNEVVFVDATGDYLVRDGQGGRLVTLSWEIDSNRERSDLNGPVPALVRYYREDGRDIERRLFSELPAALDAVERQGQSGTPEHRACVVSLGGD